MNHADRESDWLLLGLGGAAAVLDGMAILAGSLLGWAVWSLT